MTTSFLTLNLKIQLRFLGARLPLNKMDKFQKPLLYFNQLSSNIRRKWLIIFPYIIRFISLCRKRREGLRQEHLEMAASLKTIERGSTLADKLKKQLQHEKMILGQKEEVPLVLPLHTLWETLVELFPQCHIQGNDIVCHQLIRWFRYFQLVVIPRSFEKQLGEMGY